LRFVSPLVLVLVVVVVLDSAADAPQARCEATTPGVQRTTRLVLLLRGGRRWRPLRGRSDKIEDEDEDDDEDD